MTTLTHAEGPVTNGTTTDGRAAHKITANGSIPNKSATNGTYRVDNLQSAKNDDIAIIGMSCRFPQDAETTGNFWDLLLEGRSSMTPIPPEKYTATSHYHPDPAHGGTASILGGHFLKHNAAAFDAGFFGITKTEIVSMDMQCRMMLESVYETLENAGLSIDEVKGSKTSVFVGAFTDDHKVMLRVDPEMNIKHKLSGTTAGMISNRLSWFYDLRGNSLTLDTACSSSLVAIHLACEDLKSGSAEMACLHNEQSLKYLQRLISRQAIVGGVNVIEDPETTARLSILGFLSPDSRCHSFDARANGYSRGEGVGTVLLKPLALALRDGNAIRAVIRGNGANQDGKTPGITFPSKAAQIDLIKSVYSKAGLNVSATGYIEAHGTGTAAGDPIEASAIAIAFGDRKSDVPLYIGSVKSNIGHLEGASGMAGLIKSVLTLENGVIPAIYDLQKVNPKIQTKGWNIDFPAAKIPWPTSSLRRISVNSFGFGGTNAHVILDDAYHYLQERNLSGTHNTVFTTINGPRDDGIVINGNHGENGASKITRRKQIFVWSTFDEAGTKRQITKYRDYLSKVLESESQGSNFMSDLAYTLAQKRTSFPWRTFTLADSLDVLTDHLHNNDLPSAIRSLENPRLGFVLTGQGAQWYAMGRELMAYPIFKDSLRQAAEYFISLGSDWNLLDELAKGRQESNIDQPWLSQAACTALQIAILDLLAAWNIYPSRVIGHSSGEIAAAYCAKGLTRESAWKVAYIRGAVSKTLINAKGAMMAVGLGEEKLRSYIDAINSDSSGGLVAACINSPKNVTVSGPEEDVEALKSLLDKDQVFCRKLNISIAYHSPRMNAVSKVYAEMMGELHYPDKLSAKGGDCVMFSSVSGRPVTRDELCTPQYWVGNFTGPVRFAPVLSVMCSKTQSIGKMRFETDDLPISHLLEIGPHSALQSAIKETLAANQELTSIGSSFVLSRNRDACETALTAVGQLFCRGFPVDLNAVNFETTDDGHKEQFSPKLLVELPPYSWNRSQTYWVEGRLSKNFRYRKHPRHDLLGAPVPDWNIDEPRWRQLLRTNEMPWMNHHKITGSIVYPAAGYFVMAIEACRQITDADVKVTGYRIKDVSIKTALTIPENEEDGVETVFSMRRFADSAVSTSSTWREFTVSSYAPSTESWTQHCSGMISVETYAETGPVDAGREAAAELRSAALKVSQASMTCVNPMDMHASYTEWEAAGLSYGPTIRNLSDVTCENGTGNALGTIKIPNVKAIMPKEFLSPHVIHPTTMDSMLHIFLAAIKNLKGNKDAMEPVVPVFLKELWVSSSISNEPGHLLQTYGATKQVSQTKYSTNITVWAADTKEVMVTFKDVESLPVQSGSSLADGRQVCYNLEWKPDVELLSPIDGQNYFLDLLKGGDHEADDQESMRKLQLQSILYILDAVAILDRDPPKNLSAHQVQHLDWLHHHARRYHEGVIEHQTPQWKDYVQDESLKLKFLEEVENISIATRLSKRVGSQLVSIFHGQVDPLDIMFGDDILDTMYTEGLGTKNVHRMLQLYLETFSHEYTNLRVLEIGAGIGGTTGPVLETLRPRTAEGGYSKPSPLASYTYTDISSSFLEKAKEKFSYWRNVMDFKTLDIEKDVAAQGFEEGSFDLILCANVLHATADLKTTLSNVRYLLRPGGKLLLQEIISTRALWFTLCWGILPGWWLSTEANRKLEMGPLMHEKDWNDVLCATNFNGSGLILPDTDDAIVHSQSLMISTAIAPSAVEKSYPKTVLVTSGESSPISLSQPLESRLKELGMPECPIVDILDVKLLDLKDTICVVIMEYDQALLANLNESSFNGVRKLLTTCSGLLWVTTSTTKNPEAALTRGIVRTARWERDLDNINLVLLEIEDTAVSATEVASAMAKIYQAQFIDKTAQRNEEYCLSQGILKINRVVDADAMNESALNASQPTARLEAFDHDASRALMLTTGRPGLLSELQWVDWPRFEKPLLLGEIQVEMKAVGLNFLDIMVAMGEVTKTALGAEGSGIVVKVAPDVTKFKVGDRVVLCSAAMDGCFHTYTRVSQETAEKLPDNMSFEIAAGLPIIFATAYYSIYEIARLQKGETILIHAAAGGLGQAAIMLAQVVGAEIFATVSSEAKKAVLMNTYGIPESHIFSSRDASFVKGLMRMTNGRGIDVAINSLAGELMRRTWHCMAPMGRFVELGKKDIFSNAKLDMFPMSRSVIFAGFMLDTFMAVNPKGFGRLLQIVLCLWQEGKIRQTTPYNVATFSQIEEEFRNLQSGKHIGKIVLTANKGDLVRVVPKLQTPHKFDDSASYVLAGGTGGIGRSIARWMVSHGAKNIIFLSRSGANSNDMKQLMTELEERACKVTVYACDISDESRLKVVLEECRNILPPIKGCIQGAMHLQDATLMNMSYDKWSAALLPKVNGSWNLHRNLPSNMDFFVMLSSVCGLIGNRGQANYAAGNTYQDALSKHRLSQGLKSITLDLGNILSVGYVAENQKARNWDTVTAISSAATPEDEFLSILEYHVDPSHSTQSDVRCQVAFGLPNAAQYARMGIAEHSFIRDPLFTHLRTATENTTIGTDGSSSRSIQSQLRSAETKEAAVDIVISSILTKLSNSMSMPIDDIDPSKPIHHYGVDSLVAMEFRNWFARDMSADVPVLEIMGTGNIATLSEKVASLSKVVVVEA